MRTRFTYIVILVLLVSGIVFLFNVNPEITNYPPCFFKKLTGLQCPGCGSARACYHLLHGHIVKAMDYNLLLTCVLPLLFMELLSRVFLVRSAAPEKFRLIQNHVKPLHVLVLVMVFWIARNLPVAPLTFLSSDL